MDAYLSICAIYLNEATYFREWIEFHRLVGVERFFLYDHESTDSSREVLAPYVDDGTVVIHDWPVYPGQGEAYNDCLERHRGDSRWIAFIDLDEFLFSPQGTPVPEVLRDYEEFPGLGVPWAVYGPSGHKTRPPGLVTESYTVRSSASRKLLWFKVIVNPKRTRRSGRGHTFFYDDDRGGPVSRFVPFDMLRINHYWTRSEEELAAKLARERPDTGELPAFTLQRALKVTSGEDSVVDDTILQYVPALRESIEARERGAPQG
jgi:hypothetical protein